MRARRQVPTAENGAPVDVRRAGVWPALAGIWPLLAVSAVACAPPSAPLLGQGPVALDSAGGGDAGNLQVLAPERSDTMGVSEAAPQPDTDQASAAEPEASETVGTDAEVADPEPDGADVDTISETAAPDTDVALPPDLPDSPDSGSEAEIAVDGKDIDAGSPDVVDTDPIEIYDVLEVAPDGDASPDVDLSAETGLGPCAAPVGGSVCDDNDPCTTDACGPLGSCTHVAVQCDDGKPCTTDACDPGKGVCTATPVADCVPQCQPGKKWWGGAVFSCQQFAADPGWKMAPGWKARVVADASKGLKQPIALTFAGCEFGNLLYVADLAAQAVHAVNLQTGDTKLFADGTAWSPKAAMLTSIAWDTFGQFDGLLYVGDQGSDNDGDAAVFRVNPAGIATLLAKGPGPGLNDIFTLLFVDYPGYPKGLYVAGDTDGPSVDWGVLDGTGNAMTFSKVKDAEGACIDKVGKYGGGLLAARPASGGYLGSDSIDLIAADGTKIKSVATGLPGIHAPTLAPPGPFGSGLYAASWLDGTLLSLDPAGAKLVIASQLALSNYDGNILAFSPDGAILLVAEPMAGRVVCVSPQGPYTP